jgi:hypothetical protein
MTSTFTPVGFLIRCWALITNIKMNTPNALHTSTNQMILKKTHHFSIISNSLLRENESLLPQTLSRHSLLCLSLLCLSRPENEGHHLLPSSNASSLPFPQSSNRILSPPPQKSPSPPSPPSNEKRHSTPFPEVPPISCPQTSRQILSSSSITPIHVYP